MKNLLLVFILLFFAKSGTAQWNTDTLIRNQLSIVNANFDPRILEDGNGGYFVGWISGSLAGPIAFAMQRVDSAGFSLWQQNGLTIIPASVLNFADYEQIALCPGDSTDVFIVWVNSASDDRLFIQRLNESGDTLFGGNGKQFDLTFSGAQMDDVKIITDGSGGIITCTKIGSFTIDDRIILQKVDRSGNTHYPNLNYIGPTNISAIWSSVPDGNGGGFCLYEENNKNQLIHFDSTGTESWPVPLVFESRGIDDTSQAMVKDPVSNGCFIAYLDSGDAISLQYIDTTGSPRWSGTGIQVSGSQEWFFHPTVAADYNGGAFVGYSMRYNSDPDSMFYIVKHYDSNGVQTIGSDSLVILMPSAAFRFTLTADKNGGAYVAWEEYRYGRICIFSQYYSSNGIKNWRQDGYPVITAANQFDQVPCPASCNALSHQIIDAGSTGLVVTWADNRTSRLNFAVYAAKVDGAINTAIDYLSPTNSEYLFIYPIPAQEKVFLKLPASGMFVTVIDLMGKTIARLQSDKLEMEIDLSTVNPGVYFIEAADYHQKLRSKFIRN